MGKEHFAAFYVYAGGIGLEAGFSGECLGNHHAQQGRDIAFTGGRNAGGVELGQRQAAGIAHGGEKVEAAKGESAELVAFDNHLQCVIDLRSTGIRCTDSIGHRVLRSRVLRGLGHLLQQLLHGNFHQAGAQLFADGGAVRVAGDEPVRRLANNADARAKEFLAGRSQLFQDLQPLFQVLRAAMEHLPLEALLLQVGENFQRGSQRIALSGSK